VSKLIPVHTIPSHPIQTNLSLRSIYYCSPTYFLVFLMLSFLLTFTPISYIDSSSPLFMLHALPISPSWIDHADYVWRGCNK
jgi:hypothetical protein